MGAFGGLTRYLVMRVESRGEAGMIWGASESSEKVHMVDA